MPAKPQVGPPTARSTTRATPRTRREIVSLREQAEVPFGHFTDVLMTRSTNPLEPKVLEFKFYARGVGPVLAVGVSGGSDREELVEVQEGLVRPNRLECGRGGRALGIGFP